jgi:hypothetical protein
MTGFRGDNGECASFIQLGAYGVGVERLVAKGRREVDARDQRLHADGVMTLARKKATPRVRARRTGLSAKHDFVRC